MPPLISLKAVCQVATIGVWPSNRWKELETLKESCQLLEFVRRV